MCASESSSPARCQRSMPAKASMPMISTIGCEPRSARSVLQRQDRVGRARAPQFAVIHEESRVVADRGAHHREPRLRIRERRGAMRRVAGRHEGDGLRGRATRAARGPCAGGRSESGRTSRRTRRSGAWRKGRLSRAARGHGLAPAISATSAVSDVHGSPPPLPAWPLNCRSMCAAATNQGPIGWRAVRFAARETSASWRSALAP